MNKNTILSVFFAIAVATAGGAPLTPEQALSRIETGTGMKKRPSLSEVSLVKTFEDSEGVPTVYVFNRSSSDGYLIVSANDCVSPLLGYSESGAIDSDKLPLQMKKWLEGYSRQIESSSMLKPGLNDGSTQFFLPGKDVIKPLLTTKWDLDEPYNAECPEFDGKKASTGCVATAMAQIMKYFQYPIIGKESISYYCANLSQPLEMNFSTVNFNWNSMLDDYSGSYSEAQLAAVTTLMKACGYAVKMNYGPGESSTEGREIINAMPRYFNYDRNMKVIERDFYSYREWSQLIYDNLKYVGPVFYAGDVVPDSGHAFVCDGYDGNGYFHFNWGWGGENDGYFLIDVLNPFGTEVGFNINQLAVIGIRKPTNKAPDPIEIMAYGKPEWKANISSLQFQLFDEIGESSTGLYNRSNRDAMLSFALIGENLANKDGEKFYVTNDNCSFRNLAAGGNLIPSNDFTFVLWNLGLPDGTYKFTLASREEGEVNSGWIPVKTKIGSFNYVIVEKNNNSFSVVKEPHAGLSVSNLEILSPLYGNTAVKVKAHLSSGSSVPVSVGICDKEGHLFCISDIIMTDKRQNNDMEKEWIVSDWTYVEKAKGFEDSENVVLRLYDPITLTPYEGAETTAVFLGNAPATSFDSRLTIYGLSFEGGKYVVKEKSLDISLDLLVTSGYFMNPVDICLSESTDFGLENIVLQKRFNDVVALNQGDSHHFSMKLEYPEADYTKQYRLYATVNGVSTGNVIEFGFEDEFGLVENLSGEENYDVYNLTGVKILEKGKLEDLKKLIHGVYVVNGRKIKM